MTTRFTNWIKDERGVTAIEYAMIAALIAIVIVGAVTGLGSTIQGVFSTISASI
jgi:pilus assembly protein Flp/PilA